jgi:hypothetical protein
VTVPDGAVQDRDTLVEVVAVTPSPAGAAGTPVVADTDEDWVPAPPALVAATVNVQVVDADSPETVAVVPEIVTVTAPAGSSVPPMYTS